MRRGAYGIGQLRDGMQSLSELVYAGTLETKAVNHGLAEPSLFSCKQVLVVGGFNGSTFADEPLGHGGDGAGAGAAASSKPKSDREAAAEGAAAAAAGVKRSYDEDSLSVEEAMEKLTALREGVVKPAVEMMIKMVTNIQKGPAEEKYRSFSASRHRRGASLTAIPAQVR